MKIRKRKSQKTEQNPEISAGVLLGSPKNIQTGKAFFTCVPKGILVFLVIFGSLGGFLSAYDIECNYIIPGIVLFLTALYFSCLFAFRKNWQKDIGYIIYFIFYSVSIYHYRVYVNSGFAAVTNLVRQKGELYFGLEPGTEFAEKIDNRMLTVTLTFVFIGIFEIILLNIFVSNYMSLKCALFLAMPLYVIPMYFRAEPKLFFVLCMLSGLAGIIIFKNNGHYLENGKMYRGVLLGIVCCALFVGTATLFFNSTDLRKHYVENEYKTATRDGVAGFIMLGFRSFFPNYYSRGGMSGGKLDGFMALRPDYQTDLIVRFAPYDIKPVYLKAYTGTYYFRNQWRDGYWIKGERRGNSNYFRAESTEKQAKALEKAYRKDKKNNAKAVMEIVNRGASVDYFYYPYFTKFKDYDRYTKSKLSFTMGHGLSKEERYTFYPMFHETPGISDDEAVRCRIVTPENKDAIDSFLHEAGITSSDPDAIQKVVDYLKKEYSYSYTPGSVPDGKDFVNYFLLENKKGVCAHFATAATLIFRQLGIPARYVEGYAFGYSQMLKGKIREDLNYKDFYEGYSPLGKTAVMELALTDANAHAWVEVYREDTGWSIVDPTPAAIGEAENSESFLASLMNFWNGSADSETPGDIPSFNLGFLSSLQFRRITGILFVLAAIAFFLYLTLRWIQRWRRWHTKDLRANLLWYYRRFCRKKGKRDDTFQKFSLPSEQLQYLASQKGEPVPDRLIRCLEEICFGADIPQPEDYDYVIRTLRKY